jgi:predicted N-acyltransferase
MGLSIRAVDSIDAIPREAWDALAKDCPPFVRWGWIDALEKSGSATRKTGWQPRHLTAWRGTTLAGAVPAWRKFHSYGEYIYDFGWASAASELGIDYYPKLLIGVPLAPITAPRFLTAPGDDEAKSALVNAALALAADEDCSSLHVIFPTDAEASALERGGFHRRAGMQYHWTNPGYATYEDYLARFSSKRRNQLRRERAAAANQGITITTRRGATLDPVEHGKKAWRVYEATAGGRGWGHVQLTPDFFQRVFHAFRDEVEFVEAEKDGRFIAGAFNVAWRDRLFGRYWGCFEEHPFLHFHVCLYHSIDECIRLGRRVFEPGAGGEHKIARGFAPTAVHSVHRLFDPRLDRAVRDFVKREREHLAPMFEQGEEIAGMRPYERT